MNNEYLQLRTFYEEQLRLVERLVKIRKQKKISQQRLSILSGVPYATIRRFEKTGDISLSSLIKIILALHLYDELDRLFLPRHEYKNIEEVYDD